MKSKYFVSCKKATVLMSKSFEQKLSFGENIALMVHLTMCKTCTYCFRQVKKLRGLFSKYPEAISSIEPPQNTCLSQEARTRIISNLTNN